MAAKKKSTTQNENIDCQNLDPQVLYIDPEENVTAVRERLERALKEHVALVVPPQTHIRGQVAWKLLSMRARELGKDVSIVSSDPQIRALARSVHFRVMEARSA